MIYQILKQCNLLKLFKKKSIEELTLMRHLKKDVLSPIESVPKRICYVLYNSLPYASGGYATRAHGVSKGLMQNGFEVFGLTRPGFPKDSTYHASTHVTDHIIDGVHYYRILSPLFKNIYLMTYMEKSIEELEKKFRKIRPSLVLAASFYTSALPAFIAAKRLGIPCIYEVRGFYEITSASRSEKYRNSHAYHVRERMEAETAIVANHVLTLTSQMRDELVRRGVDKEKITLLPNSCDTSQFIPLARNDSLANDFNLPTNIPVIGYIGALVDYEGLDDLVEACGLLKKRGMEFRLLIVGNERKSKLSRGSVVAEIKRITKKYSLDNWLIMPGLISHEQVKHFYSLIDIAPFPRKPWPVCEMVSPIKPLEALAMQKAVVASNVAPLADLITDKQTGLLFEKGNILSLADMLYSLIINKMLRKELGENGRHFVTEQRNWSDNIAKIIPIIHKTDIPHLILGINFLIRRSQTLEDDAMPVF